MKIIKRLAIAGAAATSLIALGGCVDDYGYGVATSYGPVYDGYYDGYYGAYGDPYYGTAYPGYYGWYGGFYYPGSGVYVYDRYRRPFQWNGAQRRYWQGQSRGWGAYAGHGNHHGGANWGGFNRGSPGVGRPSGQAFRGGGGFHGGGGGFHGGGRGGRR